MKKALAVLMIVGISVFLNTVFSFSEEIIRKTELMPFTDCEDFVGDIMLPIQKVEQQVYYVGEEEVARVCLDRHFSIKKRKGIVPDGTATEYFKNGQMKFRETFEGNMRQGEAVEYFEDGKTKHKLNFKDDKLEGIRLDFYPNGKLGGEIPYKSGKPDGIAKRYDTDGILASETTFKEGEMDGELKAYYPNGKLRRQAIVKNNRDAGISKTYYENGQLQAEFDNDQKTISKVYYEDGTIHGIINYNEGGKIVGREYDRHGNLVNEEKMNQDGIEKPNSTIK